MLVQVLGDYLAGFRLWLALVARQPPPGLACYVLPAPAARSRRLGASDQAEGNEYCIVLYYCISTQMYTNQTCTKNLHELLAFHRS
eukprot:SAG31_NODE_19116_length_611_cov_19.414062_1_plen_85_part_10